MALCIWQGSWRRGGRRGIDGDGRGISGGECGTNGERGLEGDARDAREDRSSSAAERGCKEDGEEPQERGGRSRECGRGSDLHKYIEFIEMSLGIAARRILAAYQPPRRFIPSATLLLAALCALTVVLSRIY